MRALAIAAFTLDGVAAVGYIAVLAFGDKGATPTDGFLLAALLFGYFSALASLLAVSPAQRVEVRLVAERRLFERRVIDLGNPDGFERRSGRDRRESAPTLGAVL